MKLSILIPTLNGREGLLQRVLSDLDSQMAGYDCEVLLNKDNREKSIGQKRNELIKQSQADYTVFVDDDDLIPPYYVRSIMEALETSPDVVGFMGQYYVNNKKRKLFLHSIECDQYTENTSFYFRPPNHLNPIRRSIAIAFPFDSISSGEDTNWAMSIANAKAIRSEYFVDKVMYHYFYVSRKFY